MKVVRNRPLCFEPLEERALLTLLIGGNLYSDSATGTGWIYDSSTETLTLNGYSGTGIAATSQSLNILLAEGSANTVRVTDGSDAILVDGDLTVGKVSTDTTSGSLEVIVDNFVPSAASNGIDVTGDASFEDVSSMTVTMSEANTALVVGGNMTLTDNGTITLNAGATGGLNNDGCSVAGNFSIVGTGTYVNSGGFNVTGAVTQDASSTATLSAFGEEIDYLISTWEELSAAFDNVTGVNSSARQGTVTTLLFVGALNGSTATHEITVTSTLTLNNAGSSGTTTVQLLSCGDTTLTRDSSLTASALFFVGTTSVNQRNVMSFGVSGGMGSSSLTLDGGALWTSATDGAPASYAVTNASGVTTLTTTAGTVDTASDGIASTASLLDCGGTLSVYGGVILQNNANTQWVNGTASNRSQAGAVFVRGTGTGSASNPNASGNSIFTLDGGTIQNCSGQYGGGVEVYGTFYLKGGTIQNCSANVNLNNYANEGGGVFNTCNFIMTGGTISGCVACGNYYNSSSLTGQTDVYGKGGGLHNSTNAVASISGGTITENVSGWAGGGIYAGGLGSSSLTISGGMINHNLASVGGGVYLNAAVELNGGEISNNTVASNNNPHDESTVPVNRYGYGNGIFIEYRNNSATLYPTLTVGGAVTVSTNNNVYIATIQADTAYFQPIVIDSELTSPGATMLIRFGFDPTTAQIAAHETLFARYLDASIPINTAKFLLSYGADLTTQYTAVSYSSGGVNYLEIDLASSMYQARVGEYYFLTVGAALDYVNTTFAGGAAQTLYLVNNAIINAAATVLADVTLTFASETAATQSAAWDANEQFTDYATGLKVDAQTAYGDYTMIASRSLTVASGLTAIFTVASGAALTLGDGNGYLFFDGNYAYPTSISGLYVEGTDGTAAAGELTLKNNFTLQNMTNSDSASGNETGGIALSGSVVMDGGNIVNCVGSLVGGVRVLEGGTMTMNDGRIVLNLGGPAGTWGEPSEYTGAGGVLVDAGGTFLIPSEGTDVLIIENRGLYGGVENNGTLTMLAGTIRQNTASGTSAQGSGVYQNGTMNLGGTAAILTVDSSVNEVYLTSGNVLNISAAWTGGNSAASPLSIDSSTVADGTILVETSYNGPIDRDLDGVADTIDSAYDVLLSGKIVHLQGAWIVQGTDSSVTNAGKITDDQLTNELVIGSAVLTYNANAPSETTFTGSTVDPQGTTGYNGNVEVTLQMNGYSITGTTLNYQFLAWNTRDDGSGVWYYPYGSVGDRLTTVADVTLYAVWSDANVFVVNTLSDNTTVDDYTSLREAILLADAATVNPDIPISIQFETSLDAWEQSWTSVTTGIFNLVSSLPALSNPIAISTNTFYTINGINLVIDGGGDYRIFTVTGGTSALPVWITGLTLQNGGGLDPTNSQSSAHGGALYLASGAIAQIDDVIFSDNSANLAASAKASGGAIFNRGTLTVSNSVFTQSAGTSAGYQNAYYGGAIYNVGTLTLTGRTIEYCGATQSGGGLYNAGTATVSGCEWTSNRSGNNGGGICNVASSSALGVLTLSASRLVDNEAAGYGGGLCNTGNATLEHVTFTNNTSAKNGGGICNSYYSLSGAVSSMTLTECTLQGNSAVYGGGILNASTMNIYGCTLSGNSATENGGGISNTNGREGGVATTVNAALSIADSSTGTATTFSGNTALNGAGIGHWGVSLELLGKTSITGNGDSSTVHGGGLFALTGDTVQMASGVSITGNTPDNTYYLDGVPTVIEIALSAYIEETEGEKGVAESDESVLRKAADVVFAAESLLASVSETTLTDDLITTISRSTRNKKRSVFSHSPKMFARMTSGVR